MYYCFLLMLMAGNATNTWAKHFQYPPFIDPAARFFVRRRPHSIAACTISLSFPLLHAVKQTTGISQESIFCFFVSNTQLSNRQSFKPCEAFHTHPICAAHDILCSFFVLFVVAQYIPSPPFLHGICRRTTFSQLVHGLRHLR